MKTKKKLYLGCTFAQHQRLGIHAVVNARGGQQWRNFDTIEEIEMKRDARAIHAWLKGRVSIHQFNSRCCRRRPELQRLLSSYAED